MALINCLRFKINEITNYRNDAVGYHTQGAINIFRMTDLLTSDTDYQMLVEPACYVHIYPWQAPVNELKFINVFIKRTFNQSVSERRFYHVPEHHLIRFTFM